MANKNLTAAKAAKNDEFYTQLDDINKELRHYQKHFKGKTVFCNCDDPRVSNFFKYFALNFEYLGLRRLITTCYKNQNIDLFSKREAEKAVYLVYGGDKNGNHLPDPEEIGVLPLKGDGDFRSQECIELLKESDIVVTNPPFSLFREYMEQLVKYNKQFLIIGNKNAITYKEIFPLIKDNKMWMGTTPMGADMLFNVPTDEAQRLVSTGREGVKYRIVNGIVLCRAAACWFTNLDHKRRHEPLILMTMEENKRLSKHKEVRGHDYAHYDNYNAIEVPYVDAIPSDYDGVMGVPISFLDKYCPEQFEIVGITKTWFGGATKTYPEQIQVSKNGERAVVTKLNDGASIELSQAPMGATYYIVNNKLYSQMYARLLIRHRRKQ